MSDHSDLLRPQLPASAEAEAEAEAFASAHVDADGAALHALGDELHARTGDVVDRIVSMVERSGQPLDERVEEKVMRVGEVSTIAVARWMAGGGEAAAREVGREC